MQLLQRELSRVQCHHASTSTVELAAPHLQQPVRHTRFLRNSNSRRVLATNAEHPPCLLSGTAQRSVATTVRAAVRSVAQTETQGRSSSSNNASIVLGSYDEAVFEPSHDLRELAAAQLHSLFQVLRRVAPSSNGSCKACVYARRADSLDAPQMKLQRVACCKSAQAQQHSSSIFGFSSSGSGGDGSSSGSSFGSNNSFEELDEVLTLHRAAWEPGSSSGGGSSSAGCETEALLINEEIVLLPSSNLLVLPLAEAGVLVGLLVVEVRGKPGGPVPHQPQPIQQQQQQGQPAWELPPVLGLSEDVLWALRMSVPPLAKACAMDLKQALAGAQQEARQRLARSLLLEARGPLKVLGTFGSMLSPRLRTGGQTGEPESDMADGMLLQGQRLADVVAQLEAALRPAPRAGLPALGSGSAVGWGESEQQQQQQSWREPLALPGGGSSNAVAAAAVAAAGSADDGNISDEDDSWAFADNPQQQQQQQLPAATAVSSTADVQVLPPRPSPGAGSTSVQQSQQVQPVDVVCVPGLHTALESSSRDIRWSSVDTSVPTTPTAAVHSGANTSSMSSSSDGMVIDVEPPPSEVSSSSSPVQAVEAALQHKSSASGGSSQLQRQQQQQQQQPTRPAQHRGMCNVVDVLNHLLSAAASLAQIQNINLIVNSPLHLDTHNSSSSSRASSSSSSTALVLLPRPVRPLLAGVAGNVARRVLGYCVDVALQCTPQGGQLCVTARASSGGVEVSLMHTGHAQPDRLHTTTASMDAAALGGPAAAAAPAPAVAGPAGSLVRNKRQSGRQGGRKRKQVAERSSSTTSSSVATSTTGPPSSSSSSSSSRWSTGLQELSSSGLRGGSSLITLDFARQILQSIGGRLSLTYPYHFINALTGQLEVGSNIEVWLPAPAAPAASPVAS